MFCPWPGGDTLGNDRAFGVLADVDHLRAGVGLLIIVGQRNGIKLTDGIVALQDAARIFPGDRRAGFDLRPGNLRALAETLAALGDEIVNAAFAFLVAGIPVLHGRIFDLRVVDARPAPPPQRAIDFRRASAPCSLRDN